MNLIDFFKSFLLAFPGGYIGALVLNLTIASIFYSAFWKVFSKKFASRKIIKNKQISSKQLKREFKNSFFALAVAAFTSALIVTLNQYELTGLYLEIDKHPLWVALLSVPMAFIIDDFWFYWVHRLLHTPWLYKYIHAEHHKSIQVTPFTSVSFHWIEPLLLTSWIIPAAVFLPVYAPALGIVQILGLLDNFKSHLGYEIYPRKFNDSRLSFLTTSTHHSLHHTKFNYNYAVHFRFWDRLMKTEFADYEKLYLQRLEDEEISFDQVS